MHLEKREKNTMQLLESLKTQHDTNIWRYNPKNYGFSKERMEMKKISISLVKTSI